MKVTSMVRWTDSRENVLIKCFCTMEGIVNIFFQMTLVKI